MKSLLIPIVGALMTASLAACGSRTGAGTDTVAAADSSFVSPLSVRGTALVNAVGDTVVLNGPSLGWHTNWGRFYNEGTVKALKEKWGANITRAAIGAHPSGDCQNAYSVDSAKIGRAHV